MVPRAALVSWDTAGRTAAGLRGRGRAWRASATVETGAAAGEQRRGADPGSRRGDEVVTRGGFNLRDGDTVRAAEGA